MEEILKQLKIKADVVGTEQIGSVERFLLKLQPGEKLNRLKRCVPEIELEMKAPIMIRPLIDKGLVSVDLVKEQGLVSFDSLLPNLDQKYDLPIIIGRTILGEDLVLDLAKLPHLLIAGSTNSGKSVLLHSIISSLIYNNIDIILIDPKMVELTYYSDVKNLLFPIISDPDKALKVISRLVEEMDDRFALLAKKKTNNIVEFNKKSIKKLSFIVLVIDEFSSLMDAVKKDFQKSLCTLAQKSRACGIHIVIATQRPSADVITGTIKTNFPARIGFRVPQFIDSKVILDCGGAEKLLGSGDGLIISPQHDLIRFKGAYLTQDQIEQIAFDNRVGLFGKIVRKIL